MMKAQNNHIRAGALRVAYLEAGPSGGTPVVLLHGFPYDVRAKDEMAPLLTAAGCHVFSPYLRGYGETHFLSADTPRSGQQAALAHDLLAFMAALAIERPILAGYDWGGRPASLRRFGRSGWPDWFRSAVTISHKGGHKR